MKYCLCAPCEQRLSQGRARKNRARRDGRCYVCRELTGGLEPIHLGIAQGVAGYQFATFLIGITLRPSMIERDDLLRSRYKMIGSDSIKSGIAGLLSSRLSSETGAVVEHSRPEITIMVDLRDGAVTVRSKSVVLVGRYTKSSRGLSQRQGPCGECGGSGCGACGLHGIDGFESVEGRIVKFLYERFGSRQAKMTWIGGEDRTSLVGGEGRPFFAQIIDPKRRRARLAKRITLEGVEVLGLRRVPSVPSSPVRFRSKIRMAISTEGPCADLGKLGELRGARLAVYDGPRRAEKAIHGVRYRRTGPDSFVLRAEIDGGIPVREFVYGETVFPNLSDLLGVRCSCTRLDFEGILVQ